MVVAHQRHKSTGDMLVLARDQDRDQSIVRNQLSQHNLIHIKNYDGDEDDDQEQQKRMPLLDVQLDCHEDDTANRWTSCKTLDYHDEDESFLSGKQQWETSDQNERTKRASRRQESKSAGNFGLLFSLFQAHQQQHQKPESKRQHECHSDREKTRARVDASQNKTSHSPNRSIGQRQQQADGNLASAASLPHLFVAATAAGGSERTNSICAADTTRAGKAATRRESWSRAGLAQRRRRLAAAAASQGQPVMKLPRVEQRRPVLAREKRAAELRVRQMTTSASCDNNAPQQERSSCLSLADDGNCSAWLGSPPLAHGDGGSESHGLEMDRPREQQQPWLAHKSHASNNAGLGEGAGVVGETCTTAQVSGAFGDSKMAVARCIAQPSGCFGEHPDGRKVMRNTTSELDNASESRGSSSSLCFQGARTGPAGGELHNQTKREQQLVAVADGQDARRCAMASDVSSPIERQPLACQLAPQSHKSAARSTCGFAVVQRGTVSSDCTNQSAQQAATAARACNAAQMMDEVATTATKCVDDESEYANQVAQVSSGQDQVCRVQTYKNVNSKSSGQHSSTTTTASVASKLADTCASSWRMALMATSGVTSSAGSYKVAQRERLRERAPEQLQRQRKHHVAPDQPTPLLQHQQLQQRQQQKCASSQERNAHAYANNDNENIGPDTSGEYYRVGRPGAGCEEVAIDIEQQELRQLDNFNQPASSSTSRADHRATSGRRQSKPTQESVSTRGSQNGDTACHLQTATATTSSSRNGHRLTRPGRSPVSLQRQTNARLARHKLKIQQQRQEQLTRLALREREHLTSTTRFNSSQSATTCPPSTSTATSQTRRAAPAECEIEILEERELQTAGRDTQQGSSLLRGLLERLSLTSPPRVQVPGGFVPPVALVNFGPPASTRSRYQRQSSQQQVLGSTAAIEICDNYRSNATATEGRHRPSSNVISFSASSAGDQHHQSNRASPERRRELRDMQQQLTGGGGVDRHRGDKIKNLETGSQCSSSSSSSTCSSTLSLNKPFCKICHLSSTGNESDKLISPCKCSGTMQYIHCGCLLKWLEISNRTNEGAISCELCAHEYTWHKRFNYEQMKLPKCCSKDILLHLIFLGALSLMLFCALAPIFNKSVKPSTASDPLVGPLAGQSEQELTRSNMRSNSFRSHFGGGGQFQPTGSSRGAQTNVQNPSGKLASDEKFILLCAAFFFISFFVAIYSQMKTRDTLYGLIVKFANMNLTYYITEYDHGTHDQHQSSDKPAPVDGKGVAARQDRYHQQDINEQRQTIRSEVGNGDGGGGDTRRKGSA